MARESTFNLAKLSADIAQVSVRFVTTVKNGFAFVELVVLSVIVAIVAGFAVPRFVALEEEARSATVTALASEVRMTSALVHTIWLAEGQPDQIEFRGQRIGLVLGYPDRMSIAVAVARTEDFAYHAATGVFEPRNGRDPVDTSCTVRYAVPAAAGQAPHVSIDTTGC